MAWKCCWSNCSSAELVMLPVVMTSNFSQAAAQEKRIDEIHILGHNDAPLPPGQFNDVVIARAIAVGQIQRVEGILPRLPDPPCQSPRQLSVKDPFHVPTGSMRLIRLRRAAYVRTARRSSRCKSW